MFRNHLLTHFIILLIPFVGYSQKNEFKVYSNGLIYSDQAITKLRHVADSLNLKYKTCDLDKKFYAQSQTIGYIIELESGHISKARHDIAQNIAFIDFVKKYPQAKIEKNNLILRNTVSNYTGEEFIEFKHLNLENGYGFSIRSEDLGLLTTEMQNRWLYNHHEKTSYSEESLTAFYFPANFHSPEIPDTYSRMIGYSECLIDTTTAKFKENMDGNLTDLPPNWPSLTHFQKSKLLDDLRRTRVIGGCSQDSRPREHAVNIAILSAETFEWEVFLKSHLDIMNDRFERMSDGSYAQGERNTYIKELEVLNINVHDLILGISFRIQDATENHYYGSISRIGRALAEISRINEIRDSILSAISDDHLDDYNRLIAYFLFRNFNHYIEDNSIQKNNQVKLIKALNTLPDYYKDILLAKD